jgi:hypothetical protein
MQYYFPDPHPCQGREFLFFWILSHENAFYIVDSRGAFSRPTSVINHIGLSMISELPISNIQICECLGPFPCPCPCPCSRVPVHVHDHFHGHGHDMDMFELKIVDNTGHQISLMLLSSDIGKG